MSGSPPTLLPPSLKPITLPGIPADTSSAARSEQSVWSAIWNWKRRFGLSNPGSFEQLHKEIKGVFCTNFLFDGAHFTFGKNASSNFQFAHSLALGSQTQPATYSLNTIFADQNLFLNGNIDHEGTLQSRLNYNLAKGLTAKVQGQFSAGGAGQSMLQLEADYAGRDYSVNVKSVNASPLDGTGIYVGSVLQSVSKRLALGVEYAVQHPSVEVLETQSTLVAKYQGQDFVWTTNVAPAGMVQTSYFQRVNERIELGSELQVVAAPGRPMEAHCTLGGKMQFFRSTFRAQVDTTGRVSAVLEERLGEGFTLVLCGDIDHMKGQSKFGMGLQLESEGTALPSLPPQ